MIHFKNFVLAFLVVTSLGGIFEVGAQPRSGSGGGGVEVIVNGNAITRYDIQRRRAFLRLQRRGGNLEALAREELIDEMIRRVELKRRNVDITSAEVDNAFAGFAQRNGMSIAQLAQMLNQAGVTPEHFKTYIMVQMGWGRLVSSRVRSEIMVSEQDAVRRVQKNGGVKPSINEYRLQQVIFVVPAKRRAQLLTKRRREANAFRAKIDGCDNLRQLTKGMVDVTVRQPPRVLELELPDEWAKSITTTPVGKATPPLDTARGVEVMVVCSVRKTDNDRAVQLIYTAQDSGKGQEKASEIERNYMKELRDKARIQKP